MYGNWGRILFVNLSEGKIEKEELPEQVYRDFLGGYGLGARIIYSRLKPGVDALGPDNILGFTTGPLVGTPAITGCRFTVCGKSPLTGTWGDSNCGGYFGPALKQTGYDGVFFAGKAEKPVYFLIENDHVELRDASHLWGQDAFVTEDLLQSELGKDIQVACIGQAGEKLSLIAGVMNDKGRAAGRSGLGAVMGSKNLKAVVARGSIKVPLADEQAVQSTRRRYIDELKRPDVEHFRKYGTIDHVASSAFSNDSPIKNWTGIGVEDFPNAKAISDDAILKYEIKKYACWHCPIMCGGLYRVPDGPFAVAETHKPEYETCGMFGNNLLNDNIESIIKINDLCNRYGLDTISAGAAVAFAIECYEKGLIGKEDTGGLELTWGNAPAIVALVEKIGKREGFGDVLADGARAAARKIGKGSEEFTVHVQGQDLPAHDPRYAPSWGIYYKCDATPGRHTQLGLVPYDLGGGYRGLTLPEKIERHKYEGKGRWAAKVQNLLHAFYSTGVCMFAVQRTSVTAWPEFLNAITGWNYTLDDMEKIGARIAALRQSFNVREGLKVAEFAVPGRAYGRPPMTAGPMEGISLDIETMARDYYEAQGWDPVTGVPKKERLVELGLAEVAEDIHK